MNAPLRHPTWLDREAYPFPTRRQSVTGGEISFIDVGVGPPIVFLHGTPVWSYVWRKALPGLLDSGRSIVPDHLGFGLSDKPVDEDGSLQAHADRLGELLDALDLDRVLLVAHDIGGAIGLRWAADHPERVRGLVLLNTFVEPPGRGAGGLLLRFFATPLGRWLYRMTAVSPKILLPSAFSDRSLLEPATHDAYLAPWPDAESRRMMSLVPRLLTTEPLAALGSDLAALATTPARILWGEADALLPPACLEGLQRTFPQAQIDRLPGVGHFVQEEAPERIIEAVREMLAETAHPAG